MTANAASARWDRASLAVVVGLCVVKALVHLIVVTRYGYHGDELYFIECGRHLAFGYVDHAPLIPWIARLADELGGGLLTLRLPAIAAGTGTMVFAALLVRDWGGGWRAQLVALLCLLMAPAHLRLAAMLDIPVIEVFLCTATAYLVARSLSHGERRTWLLAGGMLGLAILAKHSSLLWGGALLIGILSSPERRVLASRWPWFGVAIAITLVVPNLVWQAENGFATFEFMRTLRDEILVEQGRGLFVAGQLLYFHPLALPVWAAGLVYAFTGEGRAARPFAVIFIVMFLVLFVSGGKPYYLASAYPPVLAAGGIALERWLRAHMTAWRTLAVSLTVTGAALGLLTLPVLPLPTVDATIESLLGWAVPPIALTHDLHGMYGWQEHAAAIDRVYRSLPSNERGQASVLAGSYSQAAAVNVFRQETTPRAVSGNMTYYLWGPDSPRGDVLIAYGLPLELLQRHYLTCTESARIDAPLARPWDTDLPVYVCREPLGTVADLWPELRRFGHKLPAPRAIRADGYAPQSSNLPHTAQQGR